MIMITIIAFLLWALLFFSIGAIITLNSTARPLQKKIKKILEHWNETTEVLGIAIKTMIEMQEEIDRLQLELNKKTKKKVKKTKKNGK